MCECVSGASVAAVVHCFFYLFSLFCLFFLYGWFLFFSLRFSLGGLFWSSSVFVLFLCRGVYPDLGEWRPLAQECLGL